MWLFAHLSVLCVKTLNRALKPEQGPGHGCLSSSSWCLRAAGGYRRQNVRVALHGPGEARVLEGLQHRITGRDALPRLQELAALGDLDVSGETTAEPFDLS